jgi:hypothetical protein
MGIFLGNGSSNKIISTLLQFISATNEGKRSGQLQHGTSRAER